MIKNKLNRLLSVLLSAIMLTGQFGDCPVFADSGMPVSTKSTTDTYVLTHTRQRDGSLVLSDKTEEPSLCLV